MFSKLSAEFIGTFWLVLGGCGSAVLAAAFPDVGIGLLGVSLAFGLTVLTGAYALGPISGGHFNPAVSVGLWAGGRFPAAHAAAVHRRAGRRRHRRRGRALPHRQRQRRTSASPAGSPPTATASTRRAAIRWRPALVCEVVMTFMFLLDHSRRHAQARAGRLRGPRHRPRADADPPDQHPGDEHVGEPGAQHRRPRCSSAAGRFSSCGCSGSRRSSAPCSPGSCTRRWKVASKNRR